MKMEIALEKAEKDIDCFLAGVKKEMMSTLAKQMYKTKSIADGIGSGDDIRLKVFMNGLKYVDIAKEMGIGNVWLSRVLAKPLTPTMEKRIDEAIDSLMAIKGRK